MKHTINSAVLVVTKYGALVYHPITKILFNKRYRRQRWFGFTLGQYSGQGKFMESETELGICSRDKGDARIISACLFNHCLLIGRGWTYYKMWMLRPWRGEHHA